jgi:hypothetical protein
MSRKTSKTGTWSRVFVEKLIVILLVKKKKFSVFYKTKIHCGVHKSSRWSIPEPDDSIPHLHSLFLKDDFNVIPCTLRFPKLSLPYGFQTKILYALSTSLHLVIV